MTEPGQVKPPRSREAGLIMGTLIYFIGSFGTSLLQFLFVPVITQLLPADEYAYFDLAYNAILVLIPVLTMQSIEALFRMLFSASATDRPKYLSTVGFFCLMGIAAFGGLLVVGTQLFDFIRYPVWLFFYFAGTVAYFYYQRVARCFGENKLYMLMSILHTALLLGLQLVLLLVFRMQTEALLIAGGVAPLLTSVIFESRLRVRRLFSIRAVHRDTATEVLRFSAPLIPQSVSSWSVSQVNRYIMVAVLGMTAVGIFNMAYKFSFVMYIITSVFQMAWQESAIRESDAEDSKTFYTDTFSSYMRFTMSMLLVMIPITPYILPFMLKNEYIAAWKFVPWIYLISLFEAFMNFMGTGYLVSKRTVGAFVTVLIGSIFNIIFVLALVHTMGEYAALIGCILAYALVWLLRKHTLRDIMPIRIDLGIFCLLSVLIALFITGYYLIPDAYRPIPVLLGGALFLLINRTMLGALLKGVRAMLKPKA